MGGGPPDILPRKEQKASLPTLKTLVAGLKTVAERTKYVACAGIFGYGGDVDTIWIYDPSKTTKHAFTRNLNAELRTEFPSATLHNSPWYGLKEGFHIDVVRWPKGSTWPAGPGRLWVNCFLEICNWQQIYGVPLEKSVKLPEKPRTKTDRVETFLKAEDGLNHLITILDAALGDAVGTHYFPREVCESYNVAKFFMADAIWALNGEYYTEKGPNGFNKFDIEKTSAEFLKYFKISSAQLPVFLVASAKHDIPNKQRLESLLELMEGVARTLKRRD